VYKKIYTQDGIKIQSSSEGSIQWEALLSPLIIDGLLLTSTDGLILPSSIEAAMQLVTGNTEELFILLGVEGIDQLGNKIEIDFVRHNDLRAFRKNEFKKPSITKTLYTISRKKIKIEPSSNFTNYEVVAIRYPKDMSFTNNQNCELPLGVHDDIVAMAAQLAEITTMEESLQVLTNTKSQ
jgi:hypothetical protein